MKHGRLLQVSVLGLALCSTSSAQVTRRISLASGGAQGASASESASISADGRFVAFESSASNLVGGDTNDAQDVFFRDWLNGQTEIVSVDTNSTLGNSHSQQPRVSADGRYVAFHSAATNLVSGDTNAKTDVFVRDRVLGTTQRVSVFGGGTQADGDSFVGSISADGRYVAFRSQATNLVSGDTNGVGDVFVRDRLSAVTERVSVSSGGVEGDAISSAPSISADGRYVAFSSTATNLVSSDTNGFNDVFVRDRLNSVTVRASVNNVSSQGNERSFGASISADGRYVAFTTFASNLIGPFSFDTNGVSDVLYRDLVGGTTGMASLDSSSAQGNGGSSNPSISADGRIVAFESSASNLVPGDTNVRVDVFVRVLSTNSTERVSLASGGAQGNDDSQVPSISSDGRLVVFGSYASNLVTGDTNLVPDVFLRDRDATGFTSICHPGVAGVRTCPCSNPPSASGHGCNNSSNTGGAFLTAAGIAYLSMDSLVFTTFAEKPSALSIVLQGNGLVAGGLVFGQGVRCVGGSLKRLYVKSASSGSITAPNLGGGDPTISARSAATGDSISPGQNRWYLVYYRDQTVLGGCPSSSGFNATQTGRVTWMQ